MSGQSVRDEDSTGQVHHAAGTWDQQAARYLVGCAVRKAPSGLRERLAEEWLADLTVRPGAFSRIRFGLGCCWATRVIAREFGAAAAAAGSSASGQPLLVAYGGYDFSRLSRRTTAMIAIAVLHVAVFYAYVSGFAQRIVPTPAKWLQAIPVIAQPPKPAQPVPLPPPRLARPVVEPLPTPEVDFKFPAQPTVITTARPQPNVAPAQAPAPEPVARVIGGPGAGFPDTEDYYPPSARRLGEAGAAVVSVCVDPRGRLTAAPAIVESSGIGQIDQGALRLARAGSGHYRPTTEGGRPVSACYAFRIRFQLQDQ
jgi:periplasmic protein TonB